MSELSVQSLLPALEAPTFKGWFPLLEVFLPTGVADTRQIQQATGFSRHRVARLLSRLIELAGDQIVARLPMSVPRPHARGRAPVVYRLGEAGAALLRHHGHTEAHPCRLDTPLTVAHALFTLDVRLAALQHGLQVATEKVLTYGEGKTIRPDNLVTLPDGTKALFETEQAADASLLPRILSTLRGRLDFFRSPEAAGVSPVVRILFAVARDREWQDTVAIWERAVARLAEEEGATLPFQVAAMRLADFLAEPDWAEPPAPHRWRLFPLPAADAPLFPAPRTENTEPLSITSAPAHDRLPLATVRALLEQDLAAGLADAARAQAPHPEPEFFALMHFIYAASHGREQDHLRQTRYPHASIALLRRYLDLQPRLRDHLLQAFRRGAGVSRNSVPAVLHRMQVVIRTFPAFHGLTMSPLLIVHPTPPDNQLPFPGQFGVRVTIAPYLIQALERRGPPDHDRVRAYERALAWVLWALFNHAEEIGLKRPTFW